jgi:hypothetical protein
MHVVVKVWGLPANNSPRDPSLADGPIVANLCSLGAHKDQIVIYYVKEEHRCGNLILVEVEWPLVGSSSQSDRFSKAGLLATELKAIWPNSLIEVYFNDTSVAFL